MKKCELDGCNKPVRLELHRFCCKSHAIKARARSYEWPVCQLEGCGKTIPRGSFPSGGLWSPSYHKQRKGCCKAHSILLKQKRKTSKEYVHREGYKQEYTIINDARDKFIYGAI